MKLADVFQNGAVLQQKKPIVVWGTDDNGRYVKAVLSGEEPREARAEIKDGKFVLTFAPMQAQKEPGLVLENDLGEKIELEDLAIGEVWLARRPVKYGISYEVGCRAGRFSGGV